jgi:hypothetical protein
MSEKTNGQFRGRAFVSVLAGFTFVAMAVTGLVMFFAPSCRIARDTSWTVWGYDRDQWTAVHVWFSIAFVGASMLHIYLNWAALTTYFQKKLHRRLALRAEWITALVICGVIYAGTVYEVAPFSLLTAWKDTFKRGEGGSGAGGQGWRGGRAGVQYGQNFLGSTGTNAAGRSRELERQAQSPIQSTAPYGTGQKTLKQFCSDEGIELSWAVSHLRNEGFTAREAMTMREIADGAGVHPRELRTILQAR